MGTALCSQPSRCVCGCVVMPLTALLLGGGGFKPGSLPELFLMLLFGVGLIVWGAWWLRRPDAVERAARAHVDLGLAMGPTAHGLSNRNASAWH